MNKERMINDILNICYQQIKKCSGSNATPEERAMIPDLIASFVRLMEC